ncbi:hypothetical protein ACEWAB_22535 [Vibrio parahaemolyticus]|uniref:hypothetical protein n=1 Tax=Vibrio parahaemolyticus TaxID=670 RepID=UPI000464F62E|nr:hypothetical protein [Vibrio parahaemolyticus]TOO76555.1 hypothetical protein CGH28_24495 [Vibrio parahaemolyticus]HCH4151348.1 hypothetical protein [Vibrio parahaemolyticus]
MLGVYFVTITTIALLGYALYVAFFDSGLNALTLALTAILWVWTCLLGIESLWKSSFSRCLLFMITTCSIANAFYSNNLTKPGYTEKNLDIFYDSAHLGYCSTLEQPDEAKRAWFNKNKDKLFMKCALQSNLDMQKLSVDIFKARYSDPVTGTIDIIYNNINDAHPLTCQEMAEVLNSLCPGKLHL